MTYLMALVLPYKENEHNGACAAGFFSPDTNDNIFIDWRDEFKKYAETVGWDFTEKDYQTVKNIIEFLIKHNGKKIYSVD